MAYLCHCGGLPAEVEAKNKLEALSLMEKLLHQFASENGLSPRETEVFCLLANRAVSLKEIASELKLSPNTVNNHFKSIFGKTKTNSRTDLLASLLRFSFVRAQNCKYLHKRPNVLVLDDEPDICEILNEGLTLRGLRVHCFTDSLKALEALPKLRLDVVVCDIRMPGMDGIRFLQEVRKIYPYFPGILFVSGFSKNQPESQLMDMGAIALLEKPIDMDRLFYLIMEQFIEDRYERNRYLRVDSKIPVTVDSAFSLQVDNIGYGGVFIPFSNAGGSTDRLAAFQPGEVVSFQFSLDQGERTVRVKGEVVWKRETRQGELEPGIGVKFLDLTDQDREWIRDFVRLKRILSFIPAGTVLSSAPAQETVGTL
jgi:DNA-binding NarL/FixJ family response regulator